MRTDELVGLLARGGGAVDARALTRRCAAGLLLGAGGAAVLMVLLLGARHDWADVVRLPMFWVKSAFVAGLAVASVAIALRLARPGVPLGRTPAWLAAPVLAMWGLAIVVLAGSDRAHVAALLLGSTWRTCAALIALLSVPVFAAMVWVMRGAAPTRLRAAGAAVGLVSGSVAALVYSLHCPELAAPFIGAWYLLGILVPTIAGALAGPRLLRW